MFGILQGKGRGSDRGEGSVAERRQRRRRQRGKDSVREGVERGPVMCMFGCGIL